MDALERTRAGLTPIVATVVMTAMVLTLAVSAITFLQGQQGSISEQLQDALDEEIIIDETVCNGKHVSFRITNNGEERLGTGRAELVVFERGTVNYSFRTVSVNLSGAFRQPGESGYLNISTDSTFRSGNRYTIRLDFGEFNVDRQCIGGQAWWNIDWTWRRQIIVENTDETTKDDAIAAIGINTTELIETGRLNPDCSDIRIVEDGQVRDHDLGACDVEDDLAELRFRTTVNRSDTEYDTYLYYGNLRAETAETDLGESDEDIETRFRPEEEQ